MLLIRVNIYCVLARCHAPSALRVLTHSTAKWDTANYYRYLSCMCLYLPLPLTSTLPNLVLVLSPCFTLPASRIWHGWLFFSPQYTVFTSFPRTPRSFNITHGGLFLVSFAGSSRSFQPLTARVSLGFVLYLSPYWAHWVLWL